MADDLESLALTLKAASKGAVGSARTVVRTGAALIEGTAKQSAPVDTGATRNSIGSDFSGNAHFAQADIGPTTSYSPYLENGTSRMAPRPFMGPALEKHTPEIEAAFAQATEGLL